MIVFEGDLGPSRLFCCWHCGYLVEPPAVVWVGADGASVALHGPCAARLGSHLLGDAREYELAVGGGHWTRRAARVAGHAMRREEHEEVRRGSD